VSARGRARRWIHPIAELSFVANRDGTTLPRPTGNQSPRCFWNVTPTGDYGRDCKIGRALALEYLALEEADPHGPDYLTMIVGDMPRQLTGVEVRFLAMVAYAAGAGADRARKIAAYWEEQSAACCAVMTSGDAAPSWSALLIASGVLVVLWAGERFGGDRGGCYRRGDQARRGAGKVSTQFSTQLPTTRWNSAG
jgi:hypothetical protein